MVAQSDDNACGYIVAGHFCMRMKRSSEECVTFTRRSEWMKEKRAEEDLLRDGLQPSFVADSDDDCRTGENDG